MTSVAKKTQPAPVHPKPEILVCLQDAQNLRAEAKRHAGRALLKLHDLEEGARLFGKPDAKTYRGVVRHLKELRFTLDALSSELGGVARVASGLPRFGGGR